MRDLNTLRVADYVDVIENGPSDSVRYRMIIANLPRYFHAASRAQQAKALAEPPRLTGTKWDAFLAATAEHIAILHNHPIPAWVEEKERFLDITWVPLDHYQPGYCINSFIDSPPAFLRHGALPDPRDLDHRGGEREYGYLGES